MSYSRNSQNTSESFKTFNLQSISHNSFQSHELYFAIPSYLGFCSNTKVTFQELPVFMHLGHNVVHILCSCVLLSFRVTVNSNPAV